MKYIYTLLAIALLYFAGADFMNLEDKDIPKSLVCSIESFMTAY